MCNDRRCPENIRTIVAAVNPVRISDDCGVWMRVWFEEFDGPVVFFADPFDTEIHGKELWIRAMAGEYGHVLVIDRPVSLAESTPAMLQHLSREN